MPQNGPIFVDPIAPAAGRATADRGRSVSTRDQVRFMAYTGMVSFCLRWWLTPKSNFG